MSLGVAQVNVRLVGGSDVPIRERMSLLEDDESCCCICARLLADLCRALSLDAERPEQWDVQSWRRLGFSYSGSFDYGEVARQAFYALKSLTKPS
jgi:hypothetical protein